MSKTKNDNEFFYKNDRKNKQKMTMSFFIKMIEKNKQKWEESQKAELKNNKKNG